MPIQLKCPNGHTREVGVQYAGKQVVCDVCAHVWNVPLPPPKGSGGLRVVRPISPPVADAPARRPSGSKPGAHKPTPPSEATAGPRPIRCPLCDFVGPPNASTDASGAAAAVGILAALGCIVCMALAVLGILGGAGALLVIFCPASMALGAVGLVLAVFGRSTSWNCRGCGARIATR